MSVDAIEWRRIAPDLELPLAEFFASLDAADRHFFHPHPFDAAQAKAIAHYAGKDLYHVLLEGRTVLAYGMLRGWDEGFQIPSLGMIVAAKARGRGVAKVVMSLLRLASQSRGAPRIRLKVFEENARAITLYKSLGYQFSSREADQLVGFLDLS
jgi:ribosomal protein S18 acetylase RimI-like enzyme